MGDAKSLKGSKRGWRRVKKKIEDILRKKEGELFEKRETSENREDRERRSLSKVTWFFLSFCHYHCLLSFLPITWDTFVDFAMLSHHELCWFWLDHMYFVVDTSSVLFGVIRIWLIFVSFSVCGIYSIDFFYSILRPPYSFKPMDWNLKCGSYWVHFVSNFGALFFQ